MRYKFLFKIALALQLFLFIEVNGSLDSVDQRKVVIQGAGPTGLLAGIKLYQKGLDVTIVEKREGKYTRRQIVGLDPHWVAELRELLGSQFDLLIEKGHAVLTQDHWLEITMCKLEKALKRRIEQINSIYGDHQLKLLYNTEAIKIKPPKRSGEKFRVKVRDHKTSLERDIEFDIVLFAGGGSDQNRERYLDNSVQRTQPKDYTVAIWRKNTKGAVTRTRKEHSAGFHTEKHQRFLGEVYRQLSLELSKNDQIEPDFKYRLMAILSQVRWGRGVEFREFENAYQLYVGVELPASLSYLRTRVKQFIDETENPEQKSALQFLKNRIDDSTLKTIQKLWEVSSEEFTLDKKNSSSFTVIQNAIDQPASIVSLKESKALFAAIGDALVSPHFFSGSGLTTGRRSINNLVEAVQMLDKVGDEAPVLEWLNHNQKLVIDYALQKGKAYSPQLQPQVVTEARFTKIAGFLDQDRKRNPERLDERGSYRLVKIGEGSYTIHFFDEKEKKKVVTFYLSKTGKLTTHSFSLAKEMNSWQFFRSLDIKPREGKKA